MSGYMRRAQMNREHSQRLAEQRATANAAAIRAAFAAEALKAAPIAVVWAEPPSEEVLPDVPKGSCQKCGKHIGKGLHFHTRSCKGAQ